MMLVWTGSPNRVSKSARAIRLRASIPPTGRELRRPAFGSDALSRSPTGGLGSNLRLLKSFLISRLTLPRPVASLRAPDKKRGTMRHTISVLVENKFGVLTRIAGLFSGRGYNIDTLNVAPTQDPTASRMTIVTRGDDATLEQIVKQLNKLADVIKVQDFREGEYVDRELVLVKVAVDSKTRAEVMQITDIFRAKIVDVQPKTLSIEVTGNESKIEKFLDLMKTFGVIDLTRTGKVAMPRK
jgi:acetolactate synthase-1/3 small subunit